MILLAGCENKDVSAKYRDGTYDGVGKGYSGDVKAGVVINESRIVSVTVISHCDVPPERAQECFDELIKKILANQDVEGVDAITGATITSNGLLNAVRAALAKARI